jgi:hypothetical protein
MKNVSIAGQEFNFCIMDNTNEKEVKIIFDDENYIVLEKDATMADIVTMAQIYDSKSRAKKDGWNKPIPSGYSEKKIGKFQTMIYIWNPTN